MIKKFYLAHLWAAALILTNHHLCKIQFARGAVHITSFHNYEGDGPFHQEAEQRRHRVPLSTFQEIISSEFDGFVEDDARAIYDHEISSNWNKLFTSTEPSTYSSSDNRSYPFLICHRGAGMSGRQRKIDIQRNFSSVSLRILSNARGSSCYMMSAESPDILQKITSNNNLYNKFATEIQIEPYTSHMKLRSGTLDHFARMNDLSGDDEALSDVQVSIQFCPYSTSYEDSSSVFEDSLASEYDHDSILHDIMHVHEGERMVRGVKEFITNYKKAHLSNNSRRLQKQVHFWEAILETGLPNGDEEGLCSNNLSKAMELDTDSSDGEDAIVSLNFGSRRQKHRHESTERAGSPTGVSPLSACIISLIASLSMHNGVCGIEIVPRMRPNNDIAQWVVQSGKVDARPWFDVGLTGKGQVVSMSDSGLDTDNCYFWDSSPGELKDGTVQMNRRKVVQYYPFMDSIDVSMHGTHVAGTIAGRKAEDGKQDQYGYADGIAKDAKIAFFDLGLGSDCCFTPSPRKFFNAGYSADARIHNASWGTAEQGKYITYSSKVDSYLYDHDDFLAVFPSGNDGTVNSKKSINAPGTAKNVITVGASQSSGRDLYQNMLGEDYLMDFSSRGPTADGRIKPDIVAPGNLLSSKGNQNETGECDPPSSDTQLPHAFSYSDQNYGIRYMAGTSVSTAVISGSLALLRQYFIDGWWPSGSPVVSDSLDPSSALLKAVLINGAQTLDGVQLENGTTYAVADYDMNIGFGRVNLNKSLPIEGNNDLNATLVDRKIINEAEEHSYEYTISSEDCRSYEFSATLVWVDPPASPGCIKCLLNDLDLTITSLNGETYYANGMSFLDETNNVERIRISASKGETITINVSASNLSTQNQKYALVMTDDCSGTSSSIISSSPSTAPIIISSSKEKKNKKKKKKRKKKKQKA